MIMEVSLRKNSEVRGRFRESRPPEYGLANALARKIRAEYPIKPIDCVMAEYGLTEGQARGAVYGTASRSTIDAFLKEGGWPLAVELMADLLCEPLSAFIDNIAREAADAEARSAARARAEKARLDTVARHGLGDWRE